MKQPAPPLITGKTPSRTVDEAMAPIHKQAGTPAPDLTKPQLLTIKQFGTILQVSERHVENLIARGLIKTVPNLGRSVRISPAEARRFIGAGQADGKAA